MAARAERVMILGIDAPIVPRLVALAKAGKLPTLARLLAEGVFAPNCLSPFPTITPPNWTTIATGAWPGTHGITDFEGYVPGDPLDRTHQNFDARESSAEHLWTAAERAGKRSILVNYPTSWHAGLKQGWQIGGYGLHANDLRLEVPYSIFNLNNLCEHFLLSTEPYPFANELVFSKAAGWDGVDHSPRALEATVTLRLRKMVHPLAPITWHLLVDGTAGAGYDTVTVARSKQAGGVYARLRVGEWTRNITETFGTEAGPRKAVFRMKLLELTPDAERFRLFVPGLCALNGWAVPHELEEEIASQDGMPLVRPPFDAWLMEWIDSGTLGECSEVHNAWLADASLHLLNTRPWDLYFTHIHTPDGMYHAFSVDLDPATARSGALREELERSELAHYQSVDRLLGKLVSAADDKTLVVVVSDHGAKAKMADFKVNQLLADAGLLAYLPQEEGKPPRVDWSRTRAYGQRSVHIYVNTRGRDPEGIVEPGQEYDAVRERVLKALHEHVDPATGLKPIVLALTREDARILGHCDGRSGDIIYAVDPRFSKEHGPHLPTARVGIGDLRSLFIMAGPGVKKGVTLERTVWLTDIVPTVCHLAELPVPQQCEGGIVYQALEDPDGRMKELQSLRGTVERLKRSVERPPTR
jgi:predicted AlkP superfamily phosphohydrolase/phosphomutase